jgi:hypothetical protein
MMGIDFTKDLVDEFYYGSFICILSKDNLVIKLSAENSQREKESKRKRTVLL